MSRSSVSYNRRMVEAVTDWDAFVEAQPLGHVLQTSAWGALKQAFGWRAETVRAGESGALVLFRALPLGLTLAMCRADRWPIGMTRRS